VQRLGGGLPPGSAVGRGTDAVDRHHGDRDTGDGQAQFGDRRLEAGRDGPTERGVVGRADLSTPATPRARPGRGARRSPG
jgi:hypothetical protein